MHPSLRTLIQGCDLDAEGTKAAMEQLIAAPEDPVSAAILTAWTCKGETGEELAAAAQHLLPLCVPLPVTKDVMHVIRRVPALSDALKK